jgi:uncharacterized RDD family membrane protein YckC
VFDIEVVTMIRRGRGSALVTVALRLAAIVTAVLVFVYDLAVVYFEFGALATLLAFALFPLTALGLPVLEMVRGNWLPLFATLVFIVVAGGSHSFETSRE